MHIIALNWRDLKNPRAGGAEVHCEEILRWLGHHGWRCTLLSSGFPGGAAEEDADGYRIVRAGHEYDFNLAVPFLYRRVAARDPADLVLDDINKIPFFSPLWVRTPVLGLVPHLMGASVFHEVNPLVATPIFLLERFVRPVYRRCHIEVISESTRQDLIARGFAPERIHVILCGIDRGTYHTTGAAPKTDAPSLVYVGRIKRYKCVDHAIQAMPAIRARVPTATLTIVGDGDWLPALRTLVAQLGLGEAVRFAGFVPSAEKVRLLQQAHVVVNPSMREGWGLTNVEANACGTTCVAADAPGLRDSVLDGDTGLLYPHGDVAALAERVVRILTQPALRARLEAGARRWADELTWNECGTRTRALAERVLSSG